MVIIRMKLNVALEISRFYDPINYIHDHKIRIPVTHLEDERIIKAIEKGNWKVVYNG
jgi:hypothetical protein